MSKHVARRGFKISTRRNTWILGINTEYYMIQFVTPWFAALVGRRGYANMTKFFIFN